MRLDPLIMPALALGGVGGRCGAGSLHVSGQHGEATNESKLIHT